MNSNGIEFRPRHDISCGKIRAIVKTIRNYTKKEERRQTNERMNGKIKSWIRYDLWSVIWSNRFFYDVCLFECGISILQIEDGWRQLALFLNVYNHLLALEIMMGTVYVSHRCFSISIVIHFDFPIKRRTTFIPKNSQINGTISF